MPLASGARLGAYEIVSFIDAGGMGEVYRARDTRLGREVAIKVLPSGFSGDGDRLQRFEQEARAAAALNHPGILAVHDIGTTDGAPFIVSELLEGETLRDRLATGPLPVRKAIDLGIQISQALAAAHEKAIVHRDLKPENIFINKDGRAKILDFGLAKLTQPDGALAATSNLPTTPIQTQHGLVLGTIGYMAPEQVRGLTADHRADIFAFGAVLYEMLSGQRAFRGETTADTMTAILKDDPADLPVAERKIPPALSRIVDRCLEKQPSARFASASDLAFALDELSSQSGITRAANGAETERQPTRVRRLVWVASIVALAVIAAAALPFAIVHVRETPPVHDVMRFSVDPAANSTLTPTAPSISPDGRLLAFTASSNAGIVVWIRSFDALAPRQLLGTEGAQAVFWSPDSRFVAFFSEGKLKKTSASGGPVQTLSDAPGAGGGGDWNQDETIVFGRRGSGIFRVSAAGGQVTRLTTPNASRNEASHLSPSFLPDGRTFVYFAIPSGKIYLRSLESQDVKELTNANSKAIYSRSGHLVFAREGTLVAQPFNLATQALEGEAVPVAEGLGGVGPGASAFSVNNGTLAYRAGVGSAVNQIHVVDRSGKPLKPVGEQGDYRDITLSPDGTRVIVHRHDDAAGGGGLWLVDTLRGTTSRFTFTQSHDVQAQWSPDGTRVAFGSNRDGGIVNLYQKIATGGGPDEILLKSDENKGASDWSRDGRFLVYENENTKTLTDLWVLPLSGDRKPVPFLQTEFSEGQGRLSPDSRWLAYVSNETGRNEVYVQPFPQSGGKWLVSTGGGIQPHWRRDGRELYYLAPAGVGLLAVTAVDVRTTATSIEVGGPKTLFSARFPPNVTVTQPASSNVISQSYVPSPDGQRFFLLDMRNDAPPQPINVVLNWATGLKK